VIASSAFWSSWLPKTYLWADQFIGGGSEPARSGVENIPQQDSAEKAFNKLTRTFAAQMSALKEYRSKGEQKMTVQHVHVAEGGQAIVGNVNASTEGVGAQRKPEVQTHALAYAPGVEMPRHIKAEREAVPIASGSRT
jgi:hypothetical protein